MKTKDSTFFDRNSTSDFGVSGGRRALLWVLACLAYVDEVSNVSFRVVAAVSYPEVSAGPTGETRVFPPFLWAVKAANYFDRVAPRRATRHCVSEAFGRGRRKISCNDAILRDFRPRRRGFLGPGYCLCGCMHAVFALQR